MGVENREFSTPIQIRGRGSHYRKLKIFYNDGEEESQNRKLKIFYFGGEEKCENQH